MGWSVAGHSPPPHHWTPSLRSMGRRTPALPLLALLALLPPAPAQDAPRCNQGNATYWNVKDETILTSPGFETGRYPPNMSCTYVFRGTNSSSRLQMDITDLEFEDKLFSGCADYISIRDGGTKNAKELARLCGTAYNTSYSSTTDRVFITILSDALIERKGVRVEISEYFPPGCPVGWENSRAMESCYKFISKRETWPNAQDVCKQEEANLVTFRNSTEYNFVFDSYGMDETQSPWIGLNDAQTEGMFMSIFGRQEEMWPSPQPIVLNNSPETDCVFLNFSVKEGIGHTADDCQRKHPFICKKFIDGTTQAAPDQRQIFRRGKVSAAVDATVLILLAIATILLIIVLILCCNKQLKRWCCPQRQTSVNTSDNRMMRGIETHPGYSNPSMPPPRPVQTSTNRARFATELEQGASAGLNNNHERTPLPPLSRPLPPLLSESSRQGTREVVDAIVHVEPPEPEEVSMSNLNGHVSHHDDAETSFGGNAENGTHSPTHEEVVEPRITTSLPSVHGGTPQLHPVPIKESTFLSREESFAMKSRRGGDLFERPKTKFLDNVSAISLDEFWDTSKKGQ